MKTCTKCHETKELDAFFNDPRYAGGKFSQCRACRAAYQKQRRRDNPGITRGIWLKHKYGITLAKYHEILENQERGCAVCKSPEPDGSWLHVDHCHETGTVRGLLCGNCNRALGILQEDPDRIHSLAGYAASRCRGGVVA